MKLFERDPFTLMTFHKVLIVFGILFSLFFSWWNIFYFSQIKSIWSSIFSLIIAILLIIYLSRIWNKK
ncbi:MAG: hypothetical protein IPP65_12420 [Chlorobi bacterium]|jgi:glucan phosphoethanolaminetransferase (alkaline phosphatase superfamily)|nr:hypothetical protein [Chlorobiota bacterium]